MGWVISFPQADRMCGDEMFATALGYAPSVIAMFEDVKVTFLHHLAQLLWVITMVVYLVWE